MKNKKWIISGLLFIIPIIFTVLVTKIDAAPLGAGETNIGFSTFNRAVADVIGINDTWYSITEALGLVGVGVAAYFALYGFIQLIKRKSFNKVDKEIYFLAVLYLIVIGIYFFFEKFIINYRPFLIDGMLEASYPSSHTITTICICASAVIFNNKMLKSKFKKIINSALLIVMVLTVVGRFLSGYHWTTDIIGGILISCCLINLFYQVMKE